MRFLDVALSSLEYEADPSLDTVGTDGYRIRYNPYYLMDLYRKNRVFVNRAYLHMVLHCVFRHLMKRENREPTYWNLACDIAIESIIDSLYHRSIRIPKSYIRQEYYKRLNKSLKVLTCLLYTSGNRHSLHSYAPLLGNGLQKQEVPKEPRKSGLLSNWRKAMRA